jgi:hypothetical protein
MSFKRVAARAAAVVFVSLCVPAAAETEPAEPAATQPASAVGLAPPGAPPASAPPADPVESPPPSEEIYQTTVRGRRAYTAASNGTVRERDFRLRPLPRPADILQTVPGFYVAQHAGGGKANQYFLRGFDADHGTDVLLMVDGVPVNLVSHGHGQGYADLNWIIPEVVQKVEVSKGTYAPEHGDFATAGALNLVTAQTLERSAVTLEGGSFETFRGLVVASPLVEDWSPLLAAQVYGTNGPFEAPERLQRYSLFSKVSRPLGHRGSVTLGATAYGSGWNASGQIPLREVTAGRLSRFGAVNDTEGGSSTRHSAYGAWRVLTDDGEVSLTGYAVRYRFNLFSDFTFFSVDPENGDMIEQLDDRTYGGLHGAWRFTRRLGSMGFDTTFGAQLRVDDIANGLYASRARERLGTRHSDQIRQTAIGLYVSEQVQLTSWLRAIGGLRADHHVMAVDSQTAPSDSGTRQASLLSPKLSAAAQVHSTTELFANFGSGFHSNDARGAVRRVDPVTPLTPARGYELGVRSHLFERLDLAASAFVLDLDSEQVWVGDEGTTEARGASRRQGVEGEARLKILDWAYADLDVTLSRARFTGGEFAGQAVPLAPTMVLAGGISVLRPDGWFGRVGALHLGDRPATEDGFLQAQGFTRVDATVGLRTSRFELSLALQNALDAPVREAQFATVSRLPGEVGPRSCTGGSRPVTEGERFVGCEDLNFTPGAPRNVQVRASAFF